eukprot:2225132-Heterocapsa_arctica.AAC.1
MGRYRAELRLLQSGKSLPAERARALPAGRSAALSGPGVNFLLPKVNLPIKAGRFIIPVSLAAIAS